MAFLIEKLAALNTKKKDLAAQERLLKTRISRVQRLLCIPLTHPTSSDEEDDKTVAAASGVGEKAKDPKG